MHRQPDSDNTEIITSQVPESVLVILIDEEGKKVKLSLWIIQKDLAPVYELINELLGRF